jgi:hypothetical protein
MADFDVIEYTLPAHWASALINGDFSGMNADEIASYDSFMAVNGDPHFVDCDDEPHHTRWHDATDHALRAECLTYTAHVPKEDA